MMRTEREPRLRVRMQQAVEELKGLVREHYPGATFRVSRSSEEPRIVHLWTTVDVEDTDAVLDAVIDRVTEFQTDERLPIHVIPVRPRERVLAALRASEAAKARHAHRLPLQS
jgi:hypothetical protein